MPYPIQNEDHLDVTCGWYCISFINSSMSIKDFAKQFKEDKAGNFKEIENHSLKTMELFLKNIVLNQNPIPQIPKIETKPNLLNTTLEDLNSMVLSTLNQPRKLNKKIIEAPPKDNILDYNIDDLNKMNNENITQKVNKIDLKENEKLESKATSLEIWVIMKGGATFENSKTSLAAKKGQAVALLPNEIFMVTAREETLMYKAFVPESE